MLSEEKELVGAVTLSREQNVRFRHKANFLAMYVRSVMRTLGIGRKLLMKAIDQAKSILDIEQIKLMVVSNSRPALKLYRSLGLKFMEQKGMPSE